MTIYGTIQKTERWFFKKKKFLRFRRRPILAVRRRFFSVSKTAGPRCVHVRTAWRATTVLYVLRNARAVLLLYRRSTLAPRPFRHSTQAVLLHAILYDTHRSCRDIYARTVGMDRGRGVAALSPRSAHARYLRRPESLYT